MKKIFSITAVLTGLLALTSCEKVIDVKLGDADKKIVIDAALTDHAGDCVVKISQTKNFDDNNSFAGLSGAVVSIKDQAGNVTPLTEETPGIYKHATLLGAPGNSYELTVQVNGQTYKATSVMPQAVLLDSLYTKTQKFFDEDETYANVVFTDPAGTKNYYRVLQYINGSKTKTNFLLDDDLSDGKLFNSTLYFFVDDDKDKIKPGDEVRVQLQCVDAAVYIYWYSLDQSASGSSQSAAPSNPVSNISGGALGYFSAQVVSSLSVTAP